MIFSYIRVSTKGQNTDRQEDALKEYATPENTYIDKSTGKNFNRPQYMELKKVLREGDQLYIKSLDRLGRTKTDTLKEIRELQSRGVILRVLDLPTTLQEFPEGQTWILELMNNFLIELYTNLAEQELKNIKSRQREGIDAMPVNADGKRVSKKTCKEIGRPTASTPDEFITVYNGVLTGVITNKDAWTKLNISKATYYRYVKEYKSRLTEGES